jgi:transmembrane sensor
MAHRDDCTPLSEPGSSVANNRARRTLASSFQNVRHARLGWIVIQVIVQTINSHHNASSSGSSEGSHNSKQGRAPRFRRWRHFALMGAITALQLVRYANYAPAEYFAADVDHPLHVTLEDGSELDLKGDSIVALRRAEAGPRLIVTRGDVLFRMMHDAHRHVDVLAGSALIQALGTQFDVSVQREKAMIAVIDGAVMARRLSRNEISLADGGYDGQETGVRLLADEITEIRSNSSQPVIGRRIGAQEIRAMVSWNVRSFADDTLYEVVEELNRYNARPKIVIEDPSILTMRIGVGGIHMNDPQEFINRLQRMEPSLRATKGRDGEIFLRRRHGYHASHES